jgi:hypothetical protein
MPLLNFSNKLFKEGKLDRGIKMANKRIHAFVSGRVQGVFFRWETTELANDLKLTGWAKNLKDGRVEEFPMLN